MHVQLLMSGSNVVCITFCVLLLLYYFEMKLPDTHAWCTGSHIAEEETLLNSILYVCTVLYEAAQPIGEYTYFGFRGVLTTVQYVQCLIRFTTLL